MFLVRTVHTSGLSLTNYARGCAFPVTSGLDLHKMLGAVFRIAWVIIPLTGADIPVRDKGRKPKGYKSPKTRLN